MTEQIEGVVGQGTAEQECDRTTPMTEAKLLTLCQRTA